MRDWTGAQGTSERDVKMTAIATAARLGRRGPALVTIALLYVGCILAFSAVSVLGAHGRLHVSLQTGGTMLVDQSGNIPTNLGFAPGGARHTWKVFDSSNEGHATAESPCVVRPRETVRCPNVDKIELHAGRGDDEIDA